MILFDGKKEALNIDDQINILVEKSRSLLDKKSLAIIQIGENPESEKYISLKKKYGEQVGINVLEFKISTDMDDLEIFKLVTDIISEDSIGGAIVQLPLPRTSLDGVLDLIPIEKDIDMLSSSSSTIFYNGDLSRTSPVVLATEYFIDSIKENYLKSNNKSALILGSGNLVGKPIEFYLKSLGFNTKFVLDYVPGKPLNADLIVLGMGKPNLVQGADISPNSCVIDFGSTIVSGKVIGDLDMNSGIEHLGCVSGSPGGLGPLVVRFLFLNFLNGLK